MSLINEALKRTRDLSFQRPGTPPAPYRPPPLTAPPASHASSIKWMVSLIAVVVAAVGLAVILYRQSPSLLVWPAVNVAQPAPTAPAPPAANSVDPTTTPVADLTQAEAELVAESLKGMQARPDPMPLALPEPEPISPPAPTATPIPVPAPRDPPHLVLQGIIRAGAASEALINGMAYRVGDDVEGARILAIETGLVRLDYQGTEIRLRFR